MTRDQMVQKCQRALDDLGLQFYASIDFTDSIQDGYDEVVAYTECQEEYSTVNFISKKSYYDLSLYLPNLVRVISVFNHNTNLWLEPISLLELQSMRSDWEAAEGNSRWFCPISFKEIALFPRLSTAVGYMTVFYKRMAPILTGTDEINVPDSVAVESYVLQDLLDQQEEFGKAKRYFKNYSVKINEAIKHVEGRIQPDKLWYLK